MRILHLSSVYAPDAMGGAERVVEMLGIGHRAVVISKCGFGATRKVVQEICAYTTQQ